MTIQAGDLESHGTPALGAAEGEAEKVAGRSPTQLAVARFRVAMRALGITEVDPARIIQLIQKHRHWKLNGPDKLRVTLDLPDAATRIAAARGLLNALRPG